MKNILNMNDEELKRLNNELTIIAGTLGYASFQFIMFNPFKTMDGKEKVPIATLSGFIGEKDIYQFGNILISMLHTLADEGYIERKDTKCH